MNFDPADAMVLIAAWPDGMLYPEVLAWVHASKIPLNRVEVYNVQDVVVAKNLAIRDVALRSGCGHLVFIDNDIIPAAAAGAFWKSQADLVGAMFPVKDMATWADPQVFHGGLWRTHRQVLEKVGPPWFMKTYSADGCKAIRCGCDNLRRKVIEAGFTIARAGWVEHRLRRR